MVPRSLASVFVLAASLSAQLPDTKAALLRSLERIETQLTRIERNEAKRPPGRHFESARIVIRWLREEANAWNPSNPSEGKEMLEALESISETLHTAPPEEAPALAQDVAKDLFVKANHCRRRGLTDRPIVRVTPKRPGVGAVPDLKVLYVPKYRAHRPNTEAKVFEKRSTPAEHRMTPGNYMIWAAETNTSKSGKPQLAEISGSMDRSIDVDAP